MATKVNITAMFESAETKAPGELIITLKVPLKVESLSKFAKLIDDHGVMHFEATIDEAENIEVTT